MEGLNKLEQAVLDKQLAGDHPTLAILRVQAEKARVVERKDTGVGFFCDFEVEASAPSADGDFQISDVNGEFSGLAHGAGFVLFIRSGRLLTRRRPRHWRPRRVDTGVLELESIAGARPASASTTLVRGNPCGRAPPERHRPSLRGVM